MEKYDNWGPLISLKLAYIYFMQTFLIYLPFVDATYYVCLYMMHFYIWCCGRKRPHWMLLRKALRYGKVVIGKYWWLCPVFGLHRLYQLLGHLLPIESKLDSNHQEVYPGLLKLCGPFLFVFWKLSYYPFVQAGNIHCKCSGDNIAHTAPVAFHAKAGEGSFCCGMCDLMSYQIKFWVLTYSFIIRIYVYIFIAVRPAHWL